MKFLFSHRNFPAQFRHIITELGKDPKNEVVFLTGTRNLVAIQGVTKLLYKTKRRVPENSHRYLKMYEDSIIHGQAAAEAAIRLKSNGFIPDIIYAHSWGNSMFFKDIFPDTPLINYCEWYYNAQGADIGFDRIMPNYDKKALTRCNNSQFLQDLISCDKAICPTQWQKSQFPKDLQNKIEVLHDGIDTDYFIPNPDAEFILPDTGMVLTSKDEVLTYASRGMEAYRGFPQFMDAAEALLKKRPKLHIVIAGEDRVCYGPKLANGTYKSAMLKSHNYDISRLHFTGGLPYKEYRKLLQISSAHCYLTYPFILSWSMLEAMSTECLIIASKTKPVEEVIKDRKNGFLVNFYDVEELVKTVEDALDNREKYKKIRQNARRTIIEKYDLKKLLPKQIQLLKSYSKKEDENNTSNEKVINLNSIRH